MMTLPCLSSRHCRRSLAVVVALLVAARGGAVCAAVTGIGPLPYLSATDSPFVGDPSLVVQIEDFEDGLFNVPGIVNVPIPYTPLPGSIPPGDGIGIVVAPGPETDSVDGDDGLIDGSGIAGHSLRTNFFDSYLLGPVGPKISFEFLPDSHGNYPTAFGFVWTDGRPLTSLTNFILEINSSSESLTGSDASFLGDMAFTGETAEDRFFGVRSSVGLRSLRMETMVFSPVLGIDDYFELDHLQIGYPAVPEPASIVQATALAAVTLLLISRRGAGHLRGMKIVVTLLFAARCGAVCGAVTEIGALPYLSAADSPFVGDPSLVVQIEDFEDGLFNVPGIVNVPITPLLPSPISPPSGDGIGIVLGPGPETDSVDADDGLIDGLGIAGHSLRSNFFPYGVLNPDIGPEIRFSFLPDSHGNYPTAFGFVWTDGQLGTDFFSFVSEVNSSSPFVAAYTREPLGDAAFTGETGEDRFFGVRSSVGLTSLSIEIRYYYSAASGLPHFEMDHLQVGYPAVPEPASIIQAALAAMAAFYVMPRRSAAARLPR